MARTATGNYQAYITATLPGPHGWRMVATGSNACAFTDGFYVVAQSIPLVSLSDARAHLGITDTRDDEELRAVLLAAHDAVSAHLKRPVTRAARTDTLTPRGACVVLPLPDVAAVTNVTDNGTAVPPTDYRVDSRTGVLTRSSGWKGPVTVTWTTLPVEAADVRQAVLEMCRHLWETQRGTSRALPRSGDITTTGTGYALPNRVEQLLAPHRSRT